MNLRFNGIIHKQNYQILIFCSNNYNNIRFHNAKMLDHISMAWNVRWKTCADKRSKHTSMIVDNSFEAVIPGRAEVCMLVLCLCLILSIRVVVCPLYFMLWSVLFIILYICIGTYI
jgi:hypothetical protein